MTHRTKRALIVDTDSESLSAVRLSLEQLGFRCDLAADGATALERVAAHSYDTIVTELLLPNTHGGELIMSLCSLERPPVVVVYTHIMQQQVHRGLLDEGVAAIFYKPCDVSAMGDAILGMVNRRFTVWTQGVPGQVTKLLHRSDGWINRSAVRLEGFRLGIVMLAAISLSLGWGNALDPGIAGICRMYGLCGLAFYFCLEYVAYGRDRQRAALMQWAAERRLAEQLEAAAGQLTRGAAGDESASLPLNDPVEHWTPQPLSAG